ncbi:hypothetical protein ACFL2O_04290 [Thermodesulfobacteriota bacterium]
MEIFKKKKTVIFLSIMIVIVVCLFVFANTFVANILSGNVSFPDEYVGKTLTMEDGEKFVILRRLKVSLKNDGIDGGAVFKVRFKFKSLEFGTNKKLSMIPTPFLMGMKGFREKFWTFNENTGYFQGIYHWDSKRFAESYPDSFIYGLMTKRAEKETLSYEILSDTELSEYINKLLD